MGGYFFAAGLHIHFWQFLSLTVGTALVIAAGCVFNNYMDRSIDSHMARTKKRALVTGKISNRTAIIYGCILVTLGFGILIVGTNGITALLGLIGIIDYVFLYGWAKRTTASSTLVGTISGAVPPLAGYTAATGHIDAAGLLIFASLVFWQMPHFYAIAMFRRDDYAAAGLPVWPVKYGMRSTQWQILGYIVAFVVATLLLTVMGFAGYSYGVVIGLLGIAWLLIGIKTLPALSHEVWARKMFFYSLVIIICLPIMLAVANILP